MPYEAFQGEKIHFGGLMKTPVLAFVAAIMSCMLAVPAVATIRSDDLSKKVELSERAGLMSQVDAASLYLSSDRVSLAPRLRTDRIEVEATVLDPAMRTDRALIEDHVNRQMRTFGNLLRERLPIFAPDVAATFNPDTDLIFYVNTGPERTPLATVSGGRWAWSQRAPAAPSKGQFKMAPPVSRTGPDTAEVAPAYATDASSSSKVSAPMVETKKGCGCPAKKPW